VCPYVTDVFEGCEAFESFEPPPIIIGVDEVVKVGVELPRALVMRACDGGILDRPVQAFHLAIGPGMLDLGAAVLNPVFLAAHVEQMGDVRGGRAIRVARRKRELDAVVRQHGVDGVGNRGDQRDQEGGGCALFAWRTSWTKTNVLVRSIATDRDNLPSVVRTSAMSI